MIANWLGAAGACRLTCESRACPQAIPLLGSIWIMFWGSSQPKCLRIDHILVLVAFKPGLC